MKAVIRTLSDCREREGALPALAALRIEVFRAWPYLYDGSEAYEAHYLAEFMAAAGSVLVVAEVEGAIVGAATEGVAAAAILTVSDHLGEDTHLSPEERQVGFSTMAVAALDAIAGAALR